MQRQQAWTNQPSQVLAGPHFEFPVGELGSRIEDGGSDEVEVSWQTWIMDDASAASQSAW